MSDSPSSSTSSLPASNTLLALPDGPIVSGHADASSHTVSLIGGYPTFPAIPASLGLAAKAPEVIKCGVCHEAIPLLAQVYCPPEDGENDRTVYVWACPKTSCQRRDGSVRAYRASIRNDEYVQDVNEKRALAEKQAAEEREKARKNPFSVPDTNGSGGLFGSSQPLFGSSEPAQTDKPPDIANLNLNDRDRGVTYKPPVPAYQPAQYLTTIDEYLPDPDDEDMEAEKDDAMDTELRNERWEQLLPKYMDEVFERFVRRLKDAEGGSGQVLRYELGGVPLPYSSTSPLYHRLFPEAPTTRTPDEEEEPDFSAFYNPSSIPPCPRCGGKRVFEIQLVPSLISILQPDTLSTTGEDVRKKKGKQSEEERKKELARLAAVMSGEMKDEDGVGEMDWGSVLVFGCENDCVGIGEEFVAVEWESRLSSE